MQPWWAKRDFKIIIFLILPSPNFWTVVYVYQPSFTFVVCKRTQWTFSVLFCSMEKVSHMGLKQHQFEWMTKFGWMVPLSSSRVAYGDRQGIFSAPHKQTLSLRTCIKISVNTSSAWLENEQRHIIYHTSNEASVYWNLFSWTSKPCPREPEVSVRPQPEWAALWQPSLRWLTFEIPGGGAYRMWGRDQLAGFVCSDFQSVSKDCGRLLARLVGVNKKMCARKSKKAEEWK